MCWSQSDGGILNNSNFGKKLFNGKLPLPEDKNLPKTEMKFIGDPAFPLKNNIMKILSGKNLTNEQQIFNYRISRARVVIQNSFAILVPRWRILRNTLKCMPRKAEKIVLVTIALHHFINLNDHSAPIYCSRTFVDWEDDASNFHPGEWRKEIGNETAIENITNTKSKKIGSNNASKSVYQLRDNLKLYCSNEEAIDRQKKVIHSNV